MIDAVCKGWAINHDFAALAVVWRVSFAPKSLASNGCKDGISLKNFGKAGNSHVDSECKCKEISSALNSLAGRETGSAVVRDGDFEQVMASKFGLLIGLVVAV